MSPQRRFDGEIQDQIGVLFLKGWSAAQIERQLQLDFPEHRVPSSRTIQRVVKSLQEDDSSDEPADSEWSMANARGDEAQIVLPVLRAVVQESQGRRLSISIREAEWIVKVLRAAPGLPPWPAYVLATKYMQREARGAQNLMLDLSLAFQVWTGMEAVRDFWDSIGDNPAMASFVGQTDFGQEFRKMRINQHMFRRREAIQ